MTLQGMMSRPPIFESSSGSVTRGGEEEEHEFLCAEQTAKVSTPHSEGNELYGMISHLSNSSSQKYQNNGHKSEQMHADLYDQNDDDIDTFTPQEVLQATRLIRLLKQSIRSSQCRQGSRQLRLNEARVATRTASFGAVGIATPSCPEGNSGRSPKRSDNFGWPHGPQLPAAWGHGEFQALVAGMKSEHEAPEIQRQKTSKEAGQTAPCPSGQPALDTTLSLETKRSSEALGKMPGQKYAPTSSKESPRAVASYPWTHEDTGEKPEFLASRGTFAQAIPQGGYLLDTFLSGSHPSQNESLPVEANNGDEPQEIQECPYCHRTFASKSFDKHVKVCVKVFFTRRKQYDMTRKRLASVVEEAGLPVHSTVQKLRGELSSKPLEKRTEKKWQRESAQFRAAMRMARAADPREIAEAQAIFAKCSDLGVNKQCQHCGRTFGRDEALEKHEGVCQRMFKSGGGILRKGGGLCAAQGAACRLARNTTLTKRGQNSLDFTGPKRNIKPSSWGYQHRSVSQNRRSSTGDMASAISHRKNSGAPLQHCS